MKSFTSLLTYSLFRSLPLSSTHPLLPYYFTHSLTHSLFMCSTTHSLPPTLIHSLLPYPVHLTVSRTPYRIPYILPYLVQTPCRTAVPFGSSPGTSLRQRLPTFSSDPRYVCTYVIIQYCILFRVRHLVCRTSVQFTSIQHTSLKVSEQITRSDDIKSVKFTGTINIGWRILVFSENPRWSGPIVAMRTTHTVSRSQELHSAIPRSILLFHHLFFADV